MDGWRVVPVDGIEVTYEWAGWKVWAQWPTRAGREIQTRIRIHYLGPDPQLVRSTRRLNLESDSGLDKVVMAMRRHRNDDRENIDRFVNAMAENLIGWYRQGLATTYPQPKQRNGAGWLVYPVWSRTGVTAVAAAGGSYKSFIGQALALQLATGREVLTGNTRSPSGSVKTLFCDWEGEEETFAERLYALQHGAGLPVEAALAYKAMRVPLADAAGGLQEEVQRGRFGAVVIDSMSAAAGGDLIDSAVVNGFFDATRLLGVPCLVIAHKSAESVQKRSKRFFGSIMSENRVRLAWNAEKAVDGRTVVWEVFKDNNMGRMGNKLAWNVDITQDDGEDHRLEAVAFSGVNPHNVKLASDEGNTREDQIVYALASAGKPLMPGEIAQQLDMPRGSVGATLSRAVESGAIHRLGDGRYHLSPDPF